MIPQNYNRSKNIAMEHNYYIYVIGLNLLVINYLHIWFLKVFEKKLRNNKHICNFSE